MLLHDFLDFYGRTTPDAEFVAETDRTLTYGEARKATNRIANALIGAGLNKGDRFGVLGKNSIEYALLYFAASKAGAVPVPLNYRLAAPEWEFILEDAEAQVVFADAEFCEALEPVVGNLTSIRELVAIGEEAPAGILGLSDWMLEASEADPKANVAGADDVIQMYTSGTTGRPKGAILTHSSACSNVAQFAATARDGLRGRILLAPPMYHIAAACILFNGVTFGESFLLHRDFSPSATVKSLQEDGVGMLMAVPAIIQACVAVPGVADARYPALRSIGYGGSVIAETVLRRALEAFDCNFFQAYGMTESSPILTLLTPADHRRGLAGEGRLLLSAGRAVAGTELYIADGNGEEVPLGTMGEIVARGPQLMRGYWKRKEATEEALRGGWLHTGDAATMDEEGYVFIQDRMKDMIVSGGENVYPREVEEVLFKHPSIADAAVIGVPSDKWGETIHAVVVGKGEDRPDAEELSEFCREHLGGYKIPRSVEWRDALPRNPSGKVLKRVLREPHWEGLERKV